MRYGCVYVTKGRKEQWSTSWAVASLPPIGGTASACESAHRSILLRMFGVLSPIHLDPWRIRGTSNISLNIALIAPFLIFLTRTSLPLLRYPHTYTHIHSHPQKQTHSPLHIKHENLIHRRCPCTRCLRFRPDHRSWSRHPMVPGIHRRLHTGLKQHLRCQQCLSHLLPVHLHEWQVHTVHHKVHLHHCRWCPDGRQHIEFEEHFCR